MASRTLSQGTAKHPILTGFRAISLPIICGFFALGMTPAAIALAPITAKRAALAGTFNNWSLTDPANQMRGNGSRWKLSRYWPCGQYEFKFVFDANWTTHLGAAGEGRLEQPGQNITLAIPQSGNYQIELDAAKAEWSFSARKPRRPLATLRVIGSETGTADIMLDASLSQPALGRRISTCTWTVKSLDGGNASIADADQTPTLRRMHISRPGRFRIALEVSDGKYSAKTESNLALGHGWQLSLSEKDGKPFDSPLTMLPMDGGVYGATVLTNRKQKLIARVLPAAAGDNADGATCTVNCPEGIAVLLKYNPVTGHLGVSNEGFHHFRFDLPSQVIPSDLYAEQVCIVGDFNGWRSGMLPMYETFDKSRRFERIVELPDGVHHYKFVVNGAYWVQDPSADPLLRIEDGKGDYNSGLRIGPDPSLFGAPQPNQIECAAVGHDPAQQGFLQTISPSLARLGVRTLQDDVQRVELRASDDRIIPLEKTPPRGGFDYWAASCSTAHQPLKYTFTLTDGNATSLVDSTGCHKLPSKDEAAIALAVRPFEAPLTMTFQTPEWAKRAVWYQIFPERFCNGDPANDPPMTVPWSQKWDAPYNGLKSKDQARRFKESGKFFEYIFDRRYGGDIQGVRQRLGYLRDLGINAIYFNPVFQAESLHKYDASDYRHIDDFFGVAGSLNKIKGETTDPATWQWSETDKIFLAFLNEAHQMGFKVIIDGVFNHVGRDFWAFKDVLRNGRKSPYADWFDITSWKPFHYRAWDKDDGSLPRLKHDDALGLVTPVREHLFAVTRRWMDPNGDGDPSDGIDGWRLDVASDINANFWRDWRNVVKSTNPDAYIVAELWEESKVWLDGQTFDAVMNYPFARACQRFFVNEKKRTKPSVLHAQFAEVLAWYPPQVNYVLQNLFDSHDTDRVASMFMNPDLEYDQANRLQDNGPNYDTSRPTRECYERLKLMVTCQMTHLGAPMVYYGDEVGMYGADDPSCRKPMLWADLLPYDDPDEKIEPGLFDHYKRMIAIRNSYPALQLGSYDLLACDDARGIYAIRRSLDGVSIVVVLNNSPANQTIDLPSPWEDGASLVRLEDSDTCDLVEPPAGNKMRRAGVVPRKGVDSKLRSDNGMIRGLSLAPYGAAILVQAAD